MLKKTRILRSNKYIVLILTIWLNTSLVAQETNNWQWKEIDEVTTNKILDILDISDVEKMYAQSEEFQEILKGNISPIKDIFSIIDSLKATNSLGQLNSKIFEVAKILDQYIPTAYLSISSTLVSAKRYNDAAFLLYLGKIRVRYYSLTNKRASKGSQTIYLSYAISSIESILMGYITSSVDNAIAIKKSVLEYIKTKEYEPSKIDKDLYAKSFLIIEDNIKQFEDSREDMEMMSLYARESLAQELVIEEAKLKVTNKDMTGDWYDIGYVDSPDLVFLNFAKDGTLTGIGLDRIIEELEFSNLLELSREKTISNNNGNEYSQDTELAKLKTRYKVKYKTNDNTNPIGLSILLRDPQTGEEVTIEKEVEFLTDSIIKVSYNDDYSRLKSTTLVKHSKYDYGIVPDIGNGTNFPNESDRVSKKELKAFWKKNIKAIINLDSKDIEAQTAFPIWDRSLFGVLNSQKFIENIEYHFPDEFRNALKFSDFRSIKQIKLSTGETLLGVLVLGRNYYKLENATLQEYYPQYGLAFQKSDDGWKLVTLYAAHIPNVIGAERMGYNDIFNKAVKHIRQKELLSNNIQALMKGDGQKFNSNIKWPLEGNWGNAIGLIGETGKWKKEQLDVNFEKIFLSEMRENLTEYPTRGWHYSKFSHIDYFDEYNFVEVENKTKRSEQFITEPHSFNQHLYGGVVEFNGIKYSPSIRLKYTYSQNGWELSKLAWEAKSHSIPIKASVPIEEQDAVWNELVVPMIDLDIDKIVSYTKFPFAVEYMETRDTITLNKSQFKEKLVSFFTDKIRENIREVSSYGNNRLYVSEVETPEYKVNGLFVRDPPEAKLVIVLRNGVEANIYFEKIDENWVFSSFEGNKYR